MSLQVWLPLDGSTKNQGLNDGTITWTTAASYTNNGKIGKALTTGGAKMSAEMTSQILNNKAITIALWLYVNADADDATNRAMIFGNDTMSSLGGRQFSIFRYPYADDIHLSWQNCINGTYSSIIGDVWSGVLTPHAWNHICITYNNPTIKIYVNGIQIGTATATMNTDSFNFDTNLIYSSTSHYINDFRIYDHTLSAKEVKELSRGLVLHYKLDGKDETTTNLITTEDGLSNTAYNGAIGKYGYNADSNLAKTVGDFNGRHCTKVTTITEGVSARPYVYFSNIFVSNGTNQPAYKTLSFDYYGTIGTYLNPYKLGSGTGTGTWKNVTLGLNGTFTNSGNITVEPNRWNHIELILHGTTDANAEWGYVILGDTHTTAASNYWLFANVQVETKDHATPYVGVGGSRTYTTEYDCSGYGYNGTVNGELTSSSDTSRYNASTHISATNQKIHVSGLITSGFSNSYSFSWWAKCSTWSNMMHWGFSDGVRLNGIYNGTLWNTGDGSNNPLYSIGTTTQVTAPSVNEWHHFVMTGNGSKCYVYKDGVLWAEAKTYKTISGTSIYINGWDGGTSYSNTNLNICDFRIYATALSADDILELYHTSASIDNHGNIHAYELEEV